MSKKIIVVGVIILALSMLFVGCKEKPEETTEFYGDTEEVNQIPGGNGEKPTVIVIGDADNTEEAVIDWEEVAK